MSKRDDGGAAFPRPASIDTRHGSLPDGDVVVPEQDGLSMRDWFAGMALSTSAGAFPCGIDEPYGERATAKACYAFADAMIAARKE